MKFIVTLTLDIEAEDQETANEIAIGACEHLNDTYNDDGSLDPLMAWEAVPLKEFRK